MGSSKSTEPTNTVFTCLPDYHYYSYLCFWNNQLKNLMLSKQQCASASLFHYSQVATSSPEKQSHYVTKRRSFKVNGPEKGFDLTGLEAIIRGVGVFSRFPETPSTFALLLAVC
jgi:hypothetical protein